MHGHLFLTDADNTLWDTDAVYRNAQFSLLEQVEALVGLQADAEDRLAYVREVDQLLAQGHHSGLRYPPSLLILGLKSRLAGAPLDGAVRQALVGDASAQGEQQKIVQGFFANLSKRALLRPGVTEGLARLSDAGQQVVIATEGAKDKIEGLLEVHGLGAYTHSVLSAPKAAPLYARLAKTTAGLKMMVGDQLDRDIEPAKAAGFVTAWFPGGFTPRWSSRLSVAADLEITSFDQAADAFLRLSGDGKRARQVAVKAAPRRQQSAKRRA